VVCLKEKVSLKDLNFWLKTAVIWGLISLGFFILHVLIEFGIEIAKYY